MARLSCRAHDWICWSNESSAVVGNKLGVSIWPLLGNGTVASWADLDNPNTTDWRKPNASERESLPAYIDAFLDALERVEVPDEEWP